MYLDFLDACNIQYATSRVWEKVMQYNIMGDKLLLNFWREISALIYNFTCEITKLLWQRFLHLSDKMASRFKDVMDERSYGIKRHCRKPKYAKEHN